MAKFKVGDIITGKPENGYSCTNQYALMVVTELISSYEIRAYILSSTDKSDIGRSYEVRSSSFVHTTIEAYYERCQSAPAIQAYDAAKFQIGKNDTATTKETKLESKEMFKIKSHKVIGNKVVIVEFEDGDIQKSVCMDGDVFDAERGLEVCIMKHLLGKSKYHKVLKEANKQIVALDEKAKADKAEADKEANKKAKAAKNKAERKAKRRAENIADMTEAFTAALKANGIDASVKDVSESTLDKILSVFKK